MKKPESSNKIQTTLLRQIQKQEKIIEKQKKQINQLDTENFQLKNLIDNLPGDIYWKDKEGIWSGVNKRGAQSLLQIGLIHDRADVIGKSDYQLFSKETADEYRKNDLEVMQLKTEMTREEINQLPSGKKIIQLSTKRPLWNKEGKVVGIVGNTIDISYLKKIEAELKTAIEKAEAASQAKSEFLENMRHDIRTPLTGIVGFADLLKVESDNPRIKEYSENLVASSQALLHLMDEVLEAIRVSSGEIPKLKKKFNLKSTLEHVIALNRAKAAQKRLDILFEFDLEIPHYLIGDKIRIHRVALELLVNALNFTDQGFVKLAVQLSKRENRNIVIKLIVEDTGIGIPKDKQQDIYLQFKRLTPSYKGIYKGAGLGLSVIKQFIDDLEGEIYVSSEPGKGSKFTCLFLLQESLSNDDEGIDMDFERLYDASYEDTYADHLNPASFSNLETTQSTHRILVVEDSPIAQRVAQSLLGQFQCQTDIADCGRKAVELANKNAYDLIFMDIGLPDMDGYEVTHQIRVQELKKKNHVPIIALTAHVGDENKKRCIEAGMNAVLTKPLTLQNCSDIIDSFIPGRRKENATLETIYCGDLPDNPSKLFELSQYPLLDLEDSLNTMGNKTILLEMLELMNGETLVNDVDQMIRAHSDLNWDKIQQLAHKLKGGAVYVGATRMKMACQYLERYWKSGQHDLLEPLYQQVISVINESKKVIKETLDTESHP